MYIIKEIQKIANKIDGYLHDREGQLLYNLAKKCKGRGVIVEIGSWKGKSTVWLAKGSKAGKGVKIYAVDPHTGGYEHKKFGEISTFEEFKRNIEKSQVNDIVIPLVKTSRDAAKNFNQPVELIFIDGDHEYEAVKLDFELWFPRLISGGIMAFHDVISHPGPKKVVKEFVYKSRSFRNIKFVDSIVYAEKTGANSLRDRLKNKFVFFLNNIYEFGHKLKSHLPQSVKKIGKKIIG